MDESTAIPNRPIPDGPIPDESGPAAEGGDPASGGKTPPAAQAPTMARSIPAQIGRGLLLGFVLYVLWLMIQLFL